VHAYSITESVFRMSQSETFQSLYSQLKNKILYFSFGCILTVLYNYGAIACLVNSFVLIYEASTKL